MNPPPKPPLELPRSRESRDPLADEALAWIAYLHSGSETAEDWARFDGWKAYDAEHAKAAAKAQKLWEKLGPALLEKARPRNKLIPLIAALFVGSGALLFWLGLFGEPRSFFAEYQTAVGELRSVSLRDGSTVELDSGSSFDASHDGRTIDLHSGQIFVTVKPDAAHPFEVRAAGGIIRALGTAFVVKNDGSAVSVAVSESTVRVSYGDEEARLGVGEGTKYSPSGRLQHPTRVDLDVTMAWRRGELGFWGQKLSTVIKEMQRYQRRRLVILNDDVGSLLVTGFFDARDLDTLLTSLELALPIKVTRLPGFVFISDDRSRGK